MLDFEFNKTVFLKRFIIAYTQLRKTIDVKGDGSVWHAQKGTNLRNSILRLDFCFLQTCQTEPSPLSREGDVEDHH